MIAYAAAAATAVLPEPTSPSISLDIGRPDQDFRPAGPQPDEYGVIDNIYGLPRPPLIRGERHIEVE